jgi:hypothetical protein
VTSMDERTDPGVLVIGAGLVVDQHQSKGADYAPGTCKQCTPDGCPMLREAEVVLERYRAEWREQVTTARKADDL